MGILRFKGRWCVSDGCDSLKNVLLNEDHNSKYYVHPSGDKDVPRYEIDVFGGLEQRRMLHSL